MLPENKEQGWHSLSFNTSYALFLDYSFRKDGKGLLVGPSVFVYNNAVQYGSDQKPVSFRTIYPNIRIGYALFPFKKLGLYVTPWLNVGKEFSLSHKKQRDGADFKLSDVKYIGAVHIGYRYTF